MRLITTRDLQAAQQEEEREMRDEQFQELELYYSEPYDAYDADHREDY